MENVLAIAMSKKGLYPKYIKRHTIQKQRSIQKNLTEKCGLVLICLRLTNTSEMKRNKTPLRRGKIHILNQGSKKY